MESHTAPLSFAEAIHSPCTGCSAPCCTLLQIRQFSLESLMDLDALRYYLNFERIAVSVDQSMCATVFYNTPCSHLDQATAHCDLHASGNKPDICSHYNPYQCFYAKSLDDRQQGKVSGNSEIWLTAAQFERFVTYFGFDTQRMIVQWPSADHLAELASWQTVTAPAASRKTMHAASPAKSVPIVPLNQQKPTRCDDCSAHCCTSLVFPIERNQSLADLDFLRYALGFPGVSLCINDQEWSLLIASRCQHLHEQRCHIFGQEQRPLLCQLYNANTCSYHQLFDTPPFPQLHVQQAEFEQLMDSFDYDQYGQIIAALPTAAMQEYLKQRAAMRSSVAPIASAEPALT